MMTDYRIILRSEMYVVQREVTEGNWGVESVHDQMKEARRARRFLEAADQTRAFEVLE